MQKQEQSSFAFETPSGRQEIWSMRGHHVLLRRCRRPEADFLLGEPAVPPVGMDTANARTSSPADIILNHMTDYTDWFSVIAVGSECGLWRDKARSKTLGIPRCINTTVRPGDMVIIPRTSPLGTTRRGITGLDYDVACDEADILLRIPAAA